MQESVAPTPTPLAVCVPRKLNGRALAFAQRNRLTALSSALARNNLRVLSRSNPQGAMGEDLLGNSRCQTKSLKEDLDGLVGLQDFRLRKIAVFAADNGDQLVSDVGLS